MGKKPKIKRKKTYELFKQDNLEEVIPGIGGLVLSSPLPAGILPLEALLIEPTPEEICRGEHRMMFMNTPLTDKEHEGLADLKATVAKQGKKIPKCMGAQAQANYPRSIIAQ